MSYTPPSGTISPNWPGAASYTAPGSVLVGSWGTKSYLSPTGLVATLYGVAIARRPHIIRPAGFDGSRVSGAAAVGAPGGYVPQQLVVNSSWIGKNPYSPPSLVVTASWGSVRSIAPAGIAPPDVPEPVLRWTQFAAPAGIISLMFGPNTFALFTWQYAPPEWVVNGSWVGKPTYSPPNKLVSGLWTLPSESKYIALTGEDYSAFGSHLAYNLRQIIYPAGFDAKTFGTASVRNAAQSAVVSGFSALSIGTPSVINWRSYIRPAGLVATTYGTAALAGGVRVIDLSGRGILGTAFGVQRASYAVNLIIPVGYAATTYGRPLIGYPRPVEPVGLDASVFGTADVHDNTQRIYPVGFDAKAFGTPFLAPRVRNLIQSPTIYDGGFGIASVYNKTREIFPYTDTDGTWGPYFGNFYYVENRNKTITAYGVLTQAFGLATVENGARSVQAQGLNGELYGQAMVAYRVRNVHPDSFDASFLSNWSTIRNAARVIAPTGFDSARVQAPENVFNTTREILRTGNFESLEFGQVNIDFRIRELQQVNGAQPPFVPIPTIALRQQFVVQRGADALTVGVPFVEEMFTTIAPRWVYNDMFGEGMVRNRNVSTMPYGYDQSLFGRAEVKNKNTYAPAGGIDFLAFGVHRASDRKQTINVFGFNSMRMASGHRVQLLQPDLPATQYVEVDGFGPPIPGQWVGVPNVGGNVLYPDGFDAKSFGTASVVSMGIMPMGIFLTYEEQWGLPSLNATQFVEPEGIASPTDSKYSAARIDPYTIWCDRNAPQQAVDNHGGVRFYSIDGKLYSSTETLERPFWGNARVTLKNRRITQRHADSDNMGDFSRYGDSVVSLRIRKIEPEGIKSLKFGIPQLPSGVDVQAVGLDFMGLGYPDVHIRIDPTVPRVIRPSGTVMTQFGSHRVELFIRSIYPQGADLSNLPKVLRVGPPVRAYPQGFDSAAIGAQWASYRIRRIQPVGFDAVLIGYTIGQFNQRMRVSRRDQIPSLQRVAPVGFSEVSHGQASVSNKARTIRPINCCCGARFGRAVVQLA